MDLELADRSAVDDVRPLLSTKSQEEDDDGTELSSSSMPARLEAVSVSEEWMAQAKVRSILRNVHATQINWSPYGPYSNSMHSTRFSPFFFLLTFAPVKRLPGLHY
jgi:hypothetical protein